MTAVKGQPGAAPNLPVSKGAALACFQVSLMARHDPEDARQFFNAMLKTWVALYLELRHPTESPEHA